MPRSRTSKPNSAPQRRSRSGGEELVDAGERVVAFVRQRTTGRGSGVTLEREDAMVFEVRDGRVSRLDYFNDRGQAVKAAGIAQ